VHDGPCKGASGSLLRVREEVVGLLEVVTSAEDPPAHIGKRGRVVVTRRGWKKDFRNVRDAEVKLGHVTSFGLQLVL
jgi:hypothetical protein